ncbi:hypothetical protein SDC9_49870 [bioreactor metagenome]|uniref:Uncharacterized protein n=1 Tax=bioreactor metagenome TaxID=1076179 RepID=A0A644WMH1_9ZZZZ
MEMKTQYTAILLIGGYKAFQLGCDCSMTFRLGKQLRDTGGAVGEATPEHFIIKKGLPSFVRKITMQIPKGLRKPGAFINVNGSKGVLRDILPLLQQLPDAALGLLPGDNLPGTGVQRRFAFGDVEAVLVEPNGHLFAV